MKKENNEGESTTSVKFLNKDKLKRKASEVMDKTDNELNMNKFKHESETELVERCKKLNKNEDTDVFKKKNNNTDADVKKDKNHKEKISIEKDINEIDSKIIDQKSKEENQKINILNKKQSLDNEGYLKNPNPEDIQVE